MRTSRIEISASKYLHNISQIKKYAPNCEIIAVIKANAYGIGVYEVSSILRKFSIKTFAVAFIQEAINLRKNGDLGEILVLVPNRPEDADKIVDNDLQTVVCNKETLIAISEAAKTKKYTAKLHLFVNTGMNRDGIKIEDVQEFLDFAKQHSGVKIVGILTHFADSDSEDLSFSQMQLDLFRNLIIDLKSKDYSFDYIHCSNSAGILNYNNDFCTHVRPGIALHGVMSNKNLTKKMNLEQTFTLKSRILDIKEIKAQETVGYSQKYHSSKTTTIANIPIGYGDGYPFNFCNQGKVELKGNYYNVIGSVCMDQIMIDLSRAEAELKDEVLLLSQDLDSEISIYNFARIENTIPYNIMTRFAERLPRIIID